MFAAPIIAIALIVLFLWTRECLPSSEDSSDSIDEPEDIVQALTRYLKDD